MLARSTPILLATLLSACPGTPQPSALEQRAAAQAKAAETPAPTSKPAAETPKQPVAASPKSDTPPDPAADPAAAAAAPGQLTVRPPEGTELVPVRLALKDASAYQITTIGMVAFTGVQPSAFAREERIDLGGCEGADATRRCDLTHRYVHFEGEPPNGRIFEADEKLVDKLVTSHTLLATGAREGDTTITGDQAQSASPAGQALKEVHRFFCLRFPDEPIGIGAKWKDVCHLRTGGVVDTREVVWELTSMSKDSEGHRRAEFTYLGKYTAPSPNGDRTGTVQGILYYLLDAGEPHLLKEQISTRRDPTSKFFTTTTITYQFARLKKDKKGKEIAVRTDGEPFPPEAPPAPAPAPAGNMSPAN